MSLLNLVAEHMVETGKAESVHEAVIALSSMGSDVIVELLLNIKYEVLPFSAGVRTYEMSDDERPTA